MQNALVDESTSATCFEETRSSGERQRYYCGNPLTRATLKVPFVTAKVPASAKLSSRQLPEPENVPLTRLSDMEEMDSVPDSRPQMNCVVPVVVLKPKNTSMSAQFDEQSMSTVELPVVVRGIVMRNSSIVAPPECVWSA